MSYTHSTDIAIICQDDKIKIAKEFCAGLLEKHKEENIFKGGDGNYHYVYLTINTVNSKFYVGKHTTDSLNDGYIGSGKHLSNAINRYGCHIFTNYKLKFFNKEQDAYDYELSLVSEDMIKKFKDELNITYNLRTGGVGGSTYMSKETRSKISKNLSRPEVKEKLSKASKERWSNPEYKEKVSTSIKEVRSSEESRNKTSQKSKEMWLNLEYKENHRKMMDRVREDPVCKEKHRQATQEAQNRPDVKAKRAKTLKEYYSNEDVRKEWSIKMKSIHSSLGIEHKAKKSKASKEQFINKSMIDLNGNVVKVHTDEILSKLKEGWTLNLKNGILHNPKTREKARIYLTEENGHKNLISLLEQGWLFGHLPLEYKEEAVIEYGEYCEKRKMNALF